MTNLPGVGTIAYDGRNRQVGPSTIPVRGYDASNRLIWRKVDDYTVDVDFYLPSGEKLGTYRTFVHVRYTTYDPDNPACSPWVTGRYCVAFARLTEYMYFAGRQIKTEGSTTAWVQQDRLGSAVTHLPYGDERTATANDRLKFATYWRESSGVDYAQQRYYSSTYGRFLTSDPYRASGGPSDPNSWNRYAYVQGDPVNFNDPEGLFSRAVSLARDYVHWVGAVAGLGEVPEPQGGGGAAPIDPEEDERWRKLSGDCRFGLYKSGSGGVRYGLAAIDRANKYEKEMKAAADEQLIDWRLLAAMGIRESGFENIKEKKTGGKGRGVFQIDLGWNPTVKEEEAMDIGWSIRWAAMRLV